MMRSPTLAILASLAWLLAVPALAAPDDSGSFVIDEPNGFAGVCDQPCYQVQKDFEVYLSGNPTAPGVCGAGQNTYLYTLTHLGGSGPFVPAITAFEIGIEGVVIDSAGFIPGVLDPSATAIDVPNGVVHFDFLAPPIPNGGTSSQLFLCSAFGPGAVPVSLDGQGSLDSPGTCVGPVDTSPPGSTCELDVTKTCCIPPPSGPATGNDCQGKVTKLVLSYTGDLCSETTNDQEGKASCTDGPGGAEPVDLSFTKSADIYTAVPDSGIGLGDEITITSSETQLKASTKFDLVHASGLRQSVTIHTSCSKPLNLGDQIGSMVVVGLSTTEGGDAVLPDPNAPPMTMCVGSGDPPGTPCDSRLTEAVFEYTGDDCSATTNTQEGKVVCSGDPADTEPINVAYTGKDPGLFTVTPSSVNVGETFRLTTTRDEFHSSSAFDLTNPVGGALLQEVEIHTSCSKALALGDQFGSLKLVEFSTKDGGTVMLPDPNPPAPTNECEVESAPPGPHCTTKVEAIGLRFLGGDCSSATNPQAGKAVCTDFGPVTEAGRIVVRDGGDVFLDTGAPADVQFGDVVTALASAGGQTKLPSSVDVQIFDAAGLLTQSHEIHTSCSKPLDLGDRFGALEVFSLDREDDGLVQLGGLVEYQYVITNPSPPNTGSIDNVTVTDDQLGVLASGISIPEGQSITLFEKAVLESTTMNTVTVTGEQGAVVCAADASATVTVVEPPIPPGSCADGDPRQLVFEYTGEDCSATTNTQEGKATCSGDPSGMFPVVIVPGDPGDVTVSPSTEVVSLGDLVTFTATGSKLATNTSFTIRKGGATLQTVNIHTSCSKPLAEGDQFGSMLLRTFVPE